MDRFIPDERGKYSILIFDDSEIFLSALFDLIQARIGSGIAATTSECAAIQIAETSRPKLVLVDFDMPFFSGIHSIIQLRKLLPESRIIAMSMLDQDACQQVAISSGASEFFCKSDLPNLFLEALSLS